MFWCSIFFLWVTVIVSYFSDFGPWIVLQEEPRESMKWERIFVFRLLLFEYFLSGAFSREA